MFSVKSQRVNILGLAEDKQFLSWGLQAMVCRSQYNTRDFLKKQPTISQ
jgi:hypothetical protein